MKIRQRLVTSALLLFVLLQAGCSSVSQQPEMEGNSLLSVVSEWEDKYCDSFMAYDMCAVDISHSGDVDMIYFEDTNEVFMVNPASDDTLWSALPLHECVQSMDGNMQSASNDLLTITDDTGMLTKTKMKARLMLSYSKYMNEIRRCKSTDNMELVADNSYGDTSSDIDDFGEDTFGEDFFSEEEFNDL
jgi:hypothetical protein